MNDTQTIEILKSLRLYAMASVYEASLRLAPGATPSTDALLAEMAEAEQSARRVRATERLLKRAAIRIPASLDEITFSPERNLDRDLVSRLSSMRWVSEGASVLVTGPTGAGKSFLACAFATEACLRGITTRYLRATRLFAMLRAARGDGTYFEEIARFAKTSLLVIDDFGLTPLEADDRLALLEILDDRYQRLGTIVAAQLPVSKWHAAIGEPTIADAVMDRLAHTPYIFDLKGGSRRKATQLS